MKTKKRADNKKKHSGHGKTKTVEGPRKTPSSPLEEGRTKNQRIHHRAAKRSREEASINNVQALNQNESGLDLVPRKMGTSNKRREEPGDTKAEKENRRKSKQKWVEDLKIYLGK